ncbi:MAG TPA: creatininase family protein [Longimicrobiales bacterium]|nr:creatininase family protein [Longimicrobiales bacterium]
MSARPWVLAESTWKSVKEDPYEVAVLPWGATEAHNLHLPYGTDCFETEAVAEESARKAWERGAKVVVLPTVPFGVNTQHLDIPLTLNMNPSTQMSVLTDLIESLEAHRVAKLLILNGHGGNDFRQIIRELQTQTPLFLCTTNWFAIPGLLKTFEQPGDHAGEMETSVMMHLRPDLVRPLDEAGSGHVKDWRLKALRDKWAWAPRQWTRITDDTGVGDPSAATPGKGARYFDALTTKLADFLVELSAVDPTDLYEHGI